MMDILSDTGTFVVLSGDPTSSMRTKCNDFIKQLEQVQHLTKEKAKKLKFIMLLVLTEIPRFINLKRL